MIGKVSLDPKTSPAWASYFLIPQCIEINLLGYDAFLAKAVTDLVYLGNFLILLRNGEFYIVDKIHGVSDNPQGKTDIIEKKNSASYVHTY